MEKSEINAGDERSSAGAFQRWAFQAREDERQPLALVRCLCRIFFICFHEFSAAAISLRAAALTYTIILSLVPLLAMSTAILKGMGGGDQLKIAAYRLIDQLEPGEDQAVEPAPAPSVNIPAAVSGREEEQGRRELTKDLRRAVDTVFNYVDQTNFAAIGAFGIVGLLLTIVLVMSTIEDAMNAIWHSERGRSPLRKVMDYLALLLLLPVSINVAIAGEAVLASPSIMAKIEAVIPSPWAINTLFKLLPFFFVLFSLTVMYIFFPTVRVKTAAAVTGAFFAGVFWFLGQKLYLVLQIGVAQSNAIYGSFATLPLFLVWVHLGWTFILLGATLAYAVQNRNLYRPPGTKIFPQHQLQLAFDILGLIYGNFARKKRTTFAHLSKALKSEQPGDILSTADLLTEGGILLRTDSANPIYTPAAPAESLQAGEVVHLLLGAETVATPGGLLAETVIRAASEAVPPAAFPVPDQPAAGNALSPDKEEDREKTL
ncbi:MAG: YihY/virulence factor BrkB family protein [Desulfobulbus sp.]|nr:MAG: YihY/virulence factor BrkB family protein [Desulfobulbus sp.]